MAGYLLDDESLRTLREVVRWWRGRPHADRTRPGIRHDESWPRLILVKLDAGQSLTSTPGDTATGKEQVGPPGSETDGESFTIYSGRMMANAETNIEAGDYVICAKINGYWQALAAACPPPEE